jgi:hypothetical protein
MLLLGAAMAPLRDARSLRPASVPRKRAIYGPSDPHNAEAKSHSRNNAIFGTSGATVGTTTQ